MDELMATQERIDQLTQYCDEWERSVKNAAEQRDRWLKLKSEGVSSDGLDDLISGLDVAARQFDVVFNRMRAYRDLVIAGKAE
jgi:hypothetical protein